MVCPQGAGGMAAERIRAGLRFRLLRPDGKQVWGEPGPRAAMTQRKGRLRFRPDRLP